MLCTWETLNGLMQLSNNRRVGGYLNMTWTQADYPDGVTHPQDFRGSEKTLHPVMHAWSSVYESVEGYRRAIHPQDRETTGIRRP